MGIIRNNKTMLIIYREDLQQLAKVISEVWRENDIGSVNMDWALRNLDALILKSSTYNPPTMLDEVYR